MACLLRSELDVLEIFTSKYDLLPEAFSGFLSLSQHGGRIILQHSIDSASRSRETAKGICR